MKNILVVLALIAALYKVGHAITVNPASNVTADSDATALTIPYRDANGSFSVSSITLSNLTLSSASVSGFFGLAVKAKAFFNTSTPTVVGASYLCSDCTIAYSLCVATGTTLSGFKVSHSATVGCGTNN